MPESKRRYQHGMFDVPYGLASADITTGLTIVATTGGYYHGASAIAGATAKATIKVYDNASTTSGNRLDMFVVSTDSDVWIDKYIPVIAKSGIVIEATGTGMDGVVFFVPKG